MKRKIIFFGQDWRSEIILKKLLGLNQVEIMSVVTLPAPNLVKELAQKNQIPILELTTMKPARNAWHSLAGRRFIVAEKEKPEMGILASFGVIIPKEIINLFPKGILVIHPSLLPKYRGAKPVAAAILAGERETGVTIIKMDEKFDQGAIVGQAKEKIKPTDTTEILEKRLFVLGGKVLEKILIPYCEGKIKPKPQDHKKATWAPKLKRSDGEIDWSKDEVEIDRLIRAMTPWPGTWTKVSFPIPDRKAKKRLKVIRAHLEKNKLVLDQVQLEGKKPVTWKQFKEGYPEAKIVKA